MLCMHGVQYYRVSWESMRTPCTLAAVYDVPSVTRCDALRSYALCIADALRNLARCIMHIALRVLHSSLLRHRGGCQVRQVRKPTLLLRATCKRSGALWPGGGRWAAHASRGIQ